MLSVAWRMRFPSLAFVALLAGIAPGCTVPQATGFGYGEPAEAPVAVDPAAAAALLSQFASRRISAR